MTLRGRIRWENTVIRKGVLSQRQQERCQVKTTSWAFSFLFFLRKKRKKSERGMSRERKWCMLTNWQHGERSRSYRKVNSTVSQELVVAVGFFGFFKWHDRYTLDVSKFYHPLRRIWFVFIFDRFLWSVLRSLDRRKRHLECCSVFSVIMLKTSPKFTKNC